MDSVIATEDAVRGQHTFRVGQLLDPPHHFCRLIAPLTPYKRGHVAPRSVFGLERTVVFVDHKFDQAIHECAVAGAIGGVIELWREGEMQVAEGRVPRHARQKAVFRQQGLQAVRTSGNPSRRKTDVLTDDRRSLRSYLSDNPKEAFAYAPVDLDRLGVTGEIQ